MLQEYLVTDDGENIIPLTMFENLTQVLKKNTTYKILNVQVMTYKNKKKLRSTRLMKIEVCTDEKQIPKSENLVQLNLAPKLEIESFKFSYVNDDSLIKRRICDSCKALLNNTTNTLIRCDTCSSVHLTKDDEEKFQIPLSRNRQTIVCDAHIFSSVLPKGVVVVQNENFIVYILSNTFDVHIKAIVLFRWKQQKIQPLLDLNCKNKFKNF